MNVYGTIAILIWIQEKTKANVCDDRAANGDQALMIEGRCLFANHTHLNFAQAMDYCKQTYENGHLAHMKGAEIPNIVFQWLLNTTRRSYWWIGLQQAANATNHTDEWYWINSDYTVNESATIENTAWGPDEPIERDRNCQCLVCGAISTISDVPEIQNHDCTSYRQFIWKTQTVCEIGAPDDNKKANTAITTIIWLIVAIVVVCLALVVGFVRWKPWTKIDYRLL